MSLQNVSRRTVSVFELPALFVKIHICFGQIKHTLRSVNDVTEGITQEPPIGDS